MAEKAYKGNVVRWTQEKGYETTNEIVIGKLTKSCGFDQKTWCIACEIKNERCGLISVYECAVDPATVIEIKAEKIWDKNKKSNTYTFREVGEEKNNDTK